MARTGSLRRSVHDACPISHRGGAISAPIGSHRARRPRRGDPGARVVDGPRLNDCGPIAVDTEAQITTTIPQDARPSLRVSAMGRTSRCRQARRRAGAAPASPCVSRAYLRRESQAFPEPHPRASCSVVHEFNPTPSRAIRSRGRPGGFAIVDRCTCPRPMRPMRPNATDGTDREEHGTPWKSICFEA